MREKGNEVGVLLLILSLTECFEGVCSLIIRIMSYKKSVMQFPSLAIQFHVLDNFISLNHPSIHYVIPLKVLLKLLIISEVISEDVKSYTAFTVIIRYFDENVIRFLEVSTM